MAELQNKIITSLEKKTDSGSTAVPIGVEQKYVQPIRGDNVLHNLEEESLIGIESVVDENNVVHYTNDISNNAHYSVTYDYRSNVVNDGDTNLKIDSGICEIKSKQLSYNGTDIVTYAVDNKGAQEKDGVIDNSEAPSTEKYITKYTDKLGNTYNIGVNGVEAIPGFQSAVENLAVTQLPEIVSNIKSLTVTEASGATATSANLVFRKNGSNNDSSIAVPIADSEHTGLLTKGAYSTFTGHTKQINDLKKTTDEIEKWRNDQYDGSTGTITTSGAESRIRKNADDIAALQSKLDNLRIVLDKDNWNRNKEYIFENSMFKDSLVPGVPVIDIAKVQFEEGISAEDKISQKQNLAEELGLINEISIINGKIIFICWDAVPEIDLPIYIPISTVPKEV